MSKLTLEELKRLLDYDPETGHFTWRLGRGGVKAGDRAGTPKEGYIRIHVANEFHRAHRLAWFYVHGRWPTDQIDHINKVGSDNRIINLREATYSENGRNKRMSARNTSGFRGVSFHKQMKKWNAGIGLNNRHYSLGLYDSPEEASEAYKRAADRLYGEFVPIDYEEPQT